MRYRGAGVEEDTPLVVLQSLRQVRPTTNPYLVMLVRALNAEPDVHVALFSYRRALFGSYDVFHVHWPEILLGGPRTLRRVARQVLLVAVLLRLTLSGTPVVRTLHNVARPEGLRWHEQRLLDWFDRRTRVVIRLNEHTPAPTGVPSVLVRHGHYRDWYAQAPREPAILGRIGYVGLIRRYKGVESLVEAFEDTSRSPVGVTLTLRIGGQPSSADLAERLRVAAERDDRISVDLHFLDDAELVEIVTQSSLVVLPYRFMHNSGGVLAALSLDRPVLVPDNDVNRSLAREVGKGWVLTYEGNLRDEHLEDALRQAKTRQGRPDLSAREWQRAAPEHVAAYRLASGHPTSAGSSRRPSASPLAEAS